MGNYSFQTNCDHNIECGQLINIDNVNSPEETPGDIKYIASCKDCGCEYAIQIPQSGLGLEKIDVATPKISSININQGHIEGNTSIQIDGHRLDFNNITVKFDNIEVTNISNQSDEQLTCITPPGTIKLNQIDQRIKLILSSIVGAFLPDEEIIGETTDTTSLVTLVESNFILVDHFSNELDNIVGQTSGTTATIDSIIAEFEIDEIINGETSGVTAIVKELYPLKVNSLSGLFQAGEWIVGQTSDFRIKLDETTPMDGHVNITVENDNGLGDRGTLIDGFEYTI